MFPGTAFTLRRHRLVEYVEEDQMVRADRVPDAPFASGTQGSAPWHLDRIDQDGYPLDENYAYNASGDGVRIYVIDSVTNNRVLPAVANLSHSAGSRAAADAAEDLINAGVTLVKSAGNDSEPACEAAEMHSVTSVIVVGAMEKGADRRAFFSNYGTCVDVHAPGDSIEMAGIIDDHATIADSGTSFAAPLVAGAAAMYLELYPNDSPSTVHEVLRQGATYANSNASPFLYVKQPRVKRAYWHGPTSVGAKERCTWRAKVVGGRGPFTYRWSGVLNGSRAEIQGQVASTGLLTVEVSGPHGQSASYQEWVHVGTPANCPD